MGNSFSEFNELLEQCNPRYQKAYEEGFRDAIRAMKKRIKLLEEIDLFPTSTVTTELSD